METNANLIVSECLANAKEPEKAYVEIKVVATKLSDFLGKDFPPRENILDPWLPKGGLCMVYAERGVGKTHFAIEVMMAVAYGSSFLNFSSPKPARVLYLDGEMPASTMQERIASVEQRMPPNPDMIEPVIITPDEQETCMPNLGTREGQESIQLYVDNADLIIVDNISTLCRFGKENEQSSWDPIQEWILSIRRQGKSVLLIHHAGKNGQQRGTSKREDILDTVISLKHPTDYDPAKGACFLLEFKKSRGILGEDVTALECQLTESGWTYETAEKTNYQRVVALANDKLKNHEIVDETGLTKGTVSKYVAKGKALGAIK